MNKITQFLSWIVAKAQQFNEWGAANFGTDLPGQHEDSRDFDDEALGFNDPQYNIDGSPMCCGVDINGNAYGVTKSMSSDS